MNTQHIAQYLALIKVNGLATNNLYMIDLQLPFDVYFPQMTTNANLLQSDSVKEITNSNVLSGLFDPNKYITGIENLGNMIGLGNNSTNQNSNKSPVTLSNMRMVSMLCSSAELPFYKQKVENTFINNMTHKFVTGVDTDPIRLSFYVDRGNILSTIFSRWQVSINNKEAMYDFKDPKLRKSEGFVSYKEEYEAKEMKISIINKTIDNGLKVVFSSELIGAFPTHIESLKFNVGTTELINFNVTFDYDKIRHITESNNFEENPFPTKDPLTGFNILDGKNKLEEMINTGKGLINSARSDVKGVTGNLAGIATGAILTGASKLGDMAQSGKNFITSNSNKTSNTFSNTGNTNNRRLIDSQSTTTIVR